MYAQHLRDNTDIDPVVRNYGHNLSKSFFPYHLHEVFMWQDVELPSERRESYGNMNDVLSSTMSKRRVNSCTIFLQNVDFIYD